MKDRIKSSGNIFFLLFASIALVGALAVSIQHYIIGPLRTSTSVNNKSAAEAQMEISVRVATVNSAIDQPSGGDCDADGMVEPIPYEDASPASQPIGGGLLPVGIAGSVKDPWNNRYGYCVWDHGSAVDAVGCGGAPQLRLPGTNATSWDSLAVISPGPNKVFETTCSAWADLNADLQPDTPLVQKAAGSDDIFLEWTYDQATSGGSDLWAIETLDPNTIEIAKNISVKDGSNVEQLSFDTTTKALTLGSGGSGEVPTLKLDVLQAMTNPSVELLDALVWTPEDASGTSFTWKNATGDSLTLSEGTYNIVDLSTSSQYARFGLSASDFLSYYDYGTGRPTLGLSTAANSTLDTGVQFTATNDNGGLTRRHRLSGEHTASNLETDGTSAIFFVPGANGAAATNLSGSMTLHTRTVGTVYNTDPTVKMTIASTGRVGINTTSPSGILDVDGNAYLGDGGNVRLQDTSAASAPVAKLDIGGYVTIDDGGETCDASVEGALRYYTPSTCVQVCDGVTWSCLVTDVCYDQTVTVGYFENYVNAAPSTLTKSTNIRPISGLAACTFEISVTGDGSPQYRICTDGTSDANCTSSEVQTWTSAKGSITNGQYVQLRNTSSPTAGVLYGTRLNIGSSNATWALATQGTCADGDPIGTLCADGTVYAGLTPDGATKMYTTPCAYGETWSGTACTGTASSIKWANGTSIATGVSKAAPGEANTTTLAALVNANSPYTAAKNCDLLSYGGKTDWYLPGSSEGSVVYTLCGTYPFPGCGNSYSMWSSTENNASGAYVIRFNGNLTSLSKTNTTNVYCVRKD